MKKRSRKNYPRGHWSNINNLREELAKHGGCLKEMTKNNPSAVRIAYRDGLIDELIERRAYNRVDDQPKRRIAVPKHFKTQPAM